MTKAYQLLTATSMGVRITPANQQPVGTGNLYMMQSTSAESNVLNVAASLGMRTMVLTRFVKESPIASFIKGDLRRRNIGFEGPDIVQEGPWGVRHQFNIADTGYGMRGPRVYNDRAGEVGRSICIDDFDLNRIFREEGVEIMHLSGLFAAMSPSTAELCLKLCEICRETNTKISFDMNYRASFWKGRKTGLRAVFSKIAGCADILIDGGNAHFPDTIRRCEYVESKGLLYVGTGVSGGEEDAPMVEKILDAAGQKGTGKWTAIAALDEGVPLTLIGEAVFSRCLSAMKEERVQAADMLHKSVSVFEGNREEMIEYIRQALYASKIISYAQGYQFMRAAAEHYGWKLNYGGIALMWRGGCIIRSVFLGKIKEAFDLNPNLTNLLLDPCFAEAIEKAQLGWRRVCASAMMGGIPVPAFSAALSYFDGYCCKQLPANLLQTQRDCFGAHTYERIDAPRSQFFHTNWTGEGGDTAAGVYNV